MAGETRLALDFEPGNFSRFSGVEQGSVAQAIIGGSPVRAGFGTKSCKFSNIPGVRWVNGSMRSLAARYDTHETVNQEYFFSGSLRFPSGAEQLDHGQLLWELHHPASLYNLPGLGVAPHSMRKNGTGAILANTSTGFGTVGSGYANQLSTTILASPPADQWIDFIIWIKFSEGNDGFIKWYADPTGSAAFVQGSPSAQRLALATMPFTTGIHGVLLYSEQGIYNTSGTAASQSDTDAYYSMGWRRNVSWALAVAEFGAGGGGGSSQPDPPVDPPLPPPGVPGDGPPVDAGGQPVFNALAAAPMSAIRFPCGPSWRFAVTDLAGETITLLDHLATDRVVTPKLNEALQVIGTVPSDNPQVNRLHTDGFPFLAEGVRQLYCFRRESVLPPFYKVRASTLILQTTDAGTTDPARTRFTAWDPWQYMMFRPILISPETPVDYGEPGDILQEGGITYPPDMPANQIVFDMIQNTIDFADPAAPVAAQDCFLDLTGGTIQTCATLPGDEGWTILPGTSLGKALQDICAQGVMDIVLSPIYDPAVRPGILCVLNIYNQTPPGLGAGDYRYGAVMAWDKPGRSLTAIDDLIDGTLRGNAIQYSTGLGGPPVPLQRDGASIAVYGEYNVQQFFPAPNQAQAAVVGLAAEELALRSRNKQTVTLNPAPERGPQPFVDYGLGDRVPVQASSRLRQAIPPPLPTSGGLPPDTAVFSRVYAFPISIDDNGVETVRELVIGPTGPPPPVVTPGAGGAGLLGMTAATNVAVMTSRAAVSGRRGALGPAGSRP